MIKLCLTQEIVCHCIPQANRWPVGDALEQYVILVCPPAMHHVGRRGIYYKILLITNNLGASQVGMTKMVGPHHQERVCAMCFGTVVVNKFNTSTY
jgi:hypothetical protein